MIKGNQNKNREGKINVALLGATGVVGQVFVHLLANHPWFELAFISGSQSRGGKIYRDEVQWVLPVPLPEAMALKRLEMPESLALKDRGIRIVFSALPADAAKTIEPELREMGFYIFSNASALRYEADVPILIPEVNPDALQYIKKQGYPGNGFVITNANCTTTGLAVVLAPLRQLGIREVMVSTYQSISGAGYPGLPALEIMGNTIPFIPREEEKMVLELSKILEWEVGVYPHCIRVPVLFGHLETVWLSFTEPVETDDILQAWQDFVFKAGGEALPSLPAQPVVYLENERFPQPRLSFWGSPAGMQVFTGRLRKQGDKIGFTLLVNNLVKGAAGGSIANAELFIDTYNPINEPGGGK
jgi:aspartate-semialdehyde dehydrogenase